MHTEHLHTEWAKNFGFRRSMKLFSEGGITPSGECWVSPTDTFLRIWNSPAGVSIKKQGFRLQDNGKQLGASQDRILICPRQKE
ncbi:MAG: hypothetical protein OXU36_22405 [Candidatus Poribacteria bacterium]|nr:hypothetical protein [Candidatus Poribacteria bacterium]